MAPTLVPGERVLFDRLAYEVGRPRVGDIVLARHSSRPGVRLIKRVAGVPGDGVIDGGSERVLGRDEYWLLGDARGFSTDSREFGPVRRREIVARGWFVYWPVERVRRLGKRVISNQ